MTIKDLPWLFLSLAYLAVMLPKVANGSSVCEDHFFNRYLEIIENEGTGCDSLRCERNVLAVANNLVRSGINAEELSIIYIYPRDINENLHPQQDSNLVAKYRFHAIVVHKNWIVDASYRDKETGRTGLPVRADTYFKNMFGSDNVAFDSIVARAIPLTFYKTEYERLRFAHFIYHLSTESSSYRTMPLNAFLTSLGLTNHCCQINKRPPSNHFLIENRVGTLIYHCTRRFARISLGAIVTFEYLVTPGFTAESSFEKMVGRLQSVSPKAVSIETSDGKLKEIPFELIHSKSIKALSEIDAL